VLVEFLEAGNQMVRPVITGAADRIELRPETLLAYEMHLASVDFAAEQIQPEDQHFLWAETRPQMIAQLRNGLLSQNSIPANAQFRCPMA
jgi:hypothetical protein